MRRLSRLFLPVLSLIGILGILSMTANALLVWAIRVPHSPDLTPAKAAEVISARPEFTVIGSRAYVASTTRGDDSLKTCCYTAKFIFTPNGSATPMEADAEFGYWKHSWHLQNFRYGAKTIWIESDVSPDSN